jgi:hypothetical protein
MTERTDDGRLCCVIPASVETQQPANQPEVTCLPQVPAVKSGPVSQ